MFLFKTHSAGVAKIGNPHVLVYNDSVDLEYVPVDPAILLFSG